MRPCGHDDGVYLCAGGREKCKGCVREHNARRAASHPRDRRPYFKAYNDAHREQRRAYEREKWAADPEARREQERAYRAINADRLRIYWRKYRAANRERFAGYEAKRREAKKTYRAANRHLQDEATRRRRALELGADALVIKKRDWMRLVNRFGGRCAYCGTLAKPLHQEHVVPLSRGGRHALGNLLPACGSCNHQKGAKYLIEWRAA